MTKVRYRGPQFFHDPDYYWRCRNRDAPVAAPSPRPSMTRAYDVDSRYDRRYAICVHEAAHAVVAVARAQPLFEVIVDDDGESGVCRAHPPPSPSFNSTKINYRGLCEGMDVKDYPWAFELMISYAAGALAQSRVDPDCDRVRDGARSDHERAEILAEAVTPNADAAHDMLREARREAETIIEDDWHRIERVAKALYQRGRLDEDEVRRAMFGGGYRSPERTPPTPKRAAATSSRPYTDRGPEAIGLTAQRAAPVWQERASSPYDEHLFQMRMRYLDARG